MNIKDLIELTKKYHYNLMMINSRERDLQNWVNWNQDCKAVVGAKENINTLKEANKKLQEKLQVLDIDFSCS